MSDSSSRKSGGGNGGVPGFQDNQVMFQVVKQELQEQLIQSGGGGSGYGPSPTNASGTGGSGIVLIRYKFQ